VSGIN